MATQRETNPTNRKRQPETRFGGAETRLRADAKRKQRNPFSPAVSVFRLPGLPRYTRCFKPATAVIASSNTAAAPKYN